MHNNVTSKLSQKDKLELLRKEIEVLIKRRQENKIRESQISQPRIGVGKLMVQKYQDFYRISRLIEEKLSNAKEGSFDAIAEHIKDLILKLFEKYRDINPAFFAKKKIYYLARIKQKMADLLQIKKRKALMNAKSGKPKFTKEKELAILIQLIEDTEMCINDFNPQRFDRFSKRMQDHLGLFSADEKIELLKIFDEIRPDVNNYRDAHRRKTIGEELFQELSNAKPLKFRAERAIQLLKQNLLIEDEEVGRNRQKYRPQSERPNGLSLTIEKRKNRFLMIDNYNDVIGTINNGKNIFRKYDISKDINSKAFDKTKVHDMINRMNIKSKYLLDRGLIKRKGKSSSPNLLNRTLGSKSNKLRKVNGKFYNNYGHKRANMADLDEDSILDGEYELSDTVSRRMEKLSLMRQIQDADALTLQNTLKNDNPTHNVKSSNNTNYNIDEQNENTNVFYNYNPEETSDDEYIVHKGGSTSKSKKKKGLNNSKNKKKKTSHKNSEPTIFYDDVFEIKNSKFRHSTKVRTISLPKSYDNGVDNMQNDSDSVSDLNKYLYSLTDEQLLQIQLLIDNYKGNPILDEILNDTNLNPRQKLLSILKASYAFQRFPSIPYSKHRPSEFSPNNGFLFNMIEKPIVVAREKIHKGCYSFFCKVKGQEDICPMGYANSKILDPQGNVINTRTNDILIKGDNNDKSSELKIKSKGKLVGIPTDSSRTDKTFNKMIRNNDVYDIVLGDKRMKSRTYNEKVLKHKDTPKHEADILQQQNEIRKSRRSTSQRRSTKKPVSITPISEEIPNMTNSNYFDNFDNTQKSITNISKRDDLNRFTITDKESLRAYLVSESSKNPLITKISNGQIISKPTYNEKSVVNKPEPIVEVNRASRRDHIMLSERSLHEKEHIDSKIRDKRLTHFAQDKDETDYFRLLNGDETNLNSVSNVTQTQKLKESKKNSVNAPLKISATEMKPKMETKTKSLKVSDRMLKAFSNKITESLNNKNSQTDENHKNSQSNDPRDLNIQSKVDKPGRIQSLNHQEIKSTKKSDTFDLLEESIDSVKDNTDNNYYDLLAGSISQQQKMLKTKDLDLLNFNNESIYSKNSIDAKNSLKKQRDNNKTDASDNTIMHVRPIDILSATQGVNRTKQSESFNTTTKHGNLPLLGNLDHNTNFTQKIQQNTDSNYFDLDSINDKSKPSDNDVSNLLNRHMKPNFSNPSYQARNKTTHDHNGGSQDNISDYKNNRNIKKITTISTPFSGVIEHHGYEEDIISVPRHTDDKSADISDYFNNL